MHPLLMHPSENFDSRLAAYATAATAAGVCLLAASLPARAEVVFTPAHTTFNSGTASIDLNHDGINDFVLSIYHFAPGDKRLAASGLGRGNGVLGAPSGSGYPPFAVRAGYRIGAGGEAFWKREAPAVNVAATFGSYIGGPFANTGLRFMGFKFKVNGETHYGWAALNVRARVNKHAPEIEASLLGYAYETEAEKAIPAGDTGNGANARLSDHIPEPGTLGALALGWHTPDARRSDQS
jgi:hypothetical protein